LATTLNLKQKSKSKKNPLHFDLFIVIPFSQTFDCKISTPTQSFLENKLIWLYQYRYFKNERKKILSTSTLHPPSFFRKSFLKHQMLHFVVNNGLGLQIQFTECLSLVRDMI